MDQLIHTIIEWCGSQGIGVAMLLFAVWYQNKRSREDRGDKAAEVKTALDAAEHERTARFSSLEATINHLHIRTDECEKDRRQLWQNLFQLGLKATPEKVAAGEPHL